MQEIYRISVLFQISTDVIGRTNSTNYANLVFNRLIGENVNSNNLLSKKWSSCTSELSDIRKSVMGVCLGLSYNLKQTNELVLAIDEACTNIIRYAYQNCRDGVIQIDISVDGDQVLFRMQDFAEQVSKDCIKVKRTSPLEPGGLGLMLMQKVMDSVEFVHTKECAGNILEMRKNLPKGEKLT